MKRVLGSLALAMVGFVLCLVPLFGVPHAMAWEAAGLFVIGVSYAIEPSPTWRYLVRKVRGS